MHKSAADPPVDEACREPDWVDPESRETHRPCSTPSGKPVVYSCSGCSNVAQAANRLAVRLDRDGRAEMSCIVGVAAGIPSLVRVAKSGRPILAIDGCPLACCLHALQSRGVAPTAYVDLSQFGHRKVMHADMDDTGIAQLLDQTILPIVRRLSGDGVSASGLSGACQNGTRAGGVRKL